MWVYESGIVSCVCESEWVSPISWRHKASESFWGPTPINKTLQTTTNQDFKHSTSRQYRQLKFLTEKQKVWENMEVCVYVFVCSNHTYHFLLLITHHLLNTVALQFLPHSGKWFLFTVSLGNPHQDHPHYLSSSSQVDHPFMGQVANKGPCFLPRLSVSHAVSEWSAQLIAHHLLGLIPRYNLLPLCAQSSGIQSCNLSVTRPTL